MICNLDTLYCSVCGSNDVEMKMWANPNTGEIGGESSDRFEEEDCWCKNCAEHVRLLTLEELWDKFLDVPINNNDEIEESFLSFPAGTYRFDIWHWFEERCPESLYKDLINNTNN